MKLATAHDPIVTNNYNDKNIPSEEDLIDKFFKKKGFGIVKKKEGSSNDNIIETKIGSSNVILIYKMGNEIQIL